MHPQRGQRGGNSFLTAREIISLEATFASQPATQILHLRTIASWSVVLAIKSTVPREDPSG